MQSIRVKGRKRAFTLLELLTVTAIIGILAALLLPALTQAKARARRIQCVNHLRQIGVAFQSFAHDHDGLFPMAVPAASGGNKEFATRYPNSWADTCFRLFLALSNDLATPKVLACPSDKTAEAAGSFITMNNTNISYFVGLKAEYSRPNSILSGDWNLRYEDVNVRFPQYHVVRRWFWTSDLHQFKGNLLFSDTHVEEKNSQTLSAAFEQMPDVGELALPHVPRAGSSGSPIASTPPGAGVLATRTEPAVVARGAPPTVSEQVRSSVGSFARPVGSIASDFHAISNPPPASASPRVLVGPAEKPGSADDPGFSFFPPVLGTTAVKIVRSSAWLLYLLALVLGAIALILWMRSDSQRGKNPKRDDPF